MIAAKLTARYSNAEGGEMLVQYGSGRPTHAVVVSLPDEDEIARSRI